MNFGILLRIILGNKDLIYYFNNSNNNSSFDIKIVLDWYNEDWYI